MWKIFVLLSITSLSFCDGPSTPSQALDHLMEGNKRFVKGLPQEANLTPERRKATLTQQNPFAVIVACSDSRVAPEILFDAGIGDLFVVRLAGNVVSQIGLESVNFAALQLKTPLILVMGHKNCGAVEAVLKNDIKDIKAIAKLIAPAVKQAKQSPASNLLEKAIKLNALNIKEYLMKNLDIKKQLKENQIAIHAAYYDFQTGKVELLDTPHQ